jgi:hypothetical protein
MSKPISSKVNLVVYKVKEGKDAEFCALLKAHWPALDAAGLVTKEPVKIWRGKNIRSESKGTSWVEMFSWKDESSPQVAHQMPEVMSIWEPMTPLLEGMDILNIEPAQL